MFSRKRPRRRSRAGRGARPAATGAHGAKPRGCWLCRPRAGTRRPDPRIIYTPTSQHTIGRWTPLTLQWRHIKKIAWEVIGAKGYTDTYQPTYNYLYVDDLKCVDQVVSIPFAARSASGLKLSVQGSSLNISVAKSGTMKVQVFDMMGNVVKTVSESVTSGMHQVSLEGMTRGNYVVRVMMGRDSKTARISLR